MQPDKIHPALSKQTSIINSHRMLSLQKKYKTPSIQTKQNKRFNSRSSAASVYSNSSSNCSSSSIDTEMSDVKQNAHKRVTFSINPSLTIHEHSDYDNGDHLHGANHEIIVNTETVNEMETENDSSS